MPTTGRGYRYPDSSYSTDIPEWFRQLASDVNDDIARLEAKTFTQDTVAAVVGGTSTSPTDTPGALGVWLSTAITVPAWATRAVVDSNLTGVYQIGTTPSRYELTSKLGAVSGTPVFASGGTNTTTAGRFDVSWSDLLNAITPGANTIYLMSKPSAPSSGFGAWRADDQSRFSVRFTFLP